jgi:hypothetical protein
VVLDQIVDDSPLEFERYHFEQEDGDRQRQQQQLVHGARLQYVAKDVARQRARAARAQLMDQGRSAHRPTTIDRSWRTRK